MSSFIKLVLSTVAKTDVCTTVNRTFNKASDYARDPANKLSNIWDRIDSGIKQAGRQVCDLDVDEATNPDTSREVPKMIFPKVHALLDFAGARGTLQRDDHICRGRLQP
jgi:hypothetical protein